MRTYIEQRSCCHFSRLIGRPMSRTMMHTRMECPLHVCHLRKVSCYFVNAELYHHYDTVTRTCANCKAVTPGKLASLNPSYGLQPPCTSLSLLCTSVLILAKTKKGRLAARLYPLSNAKQDSRASSTSSMHILDMITHSKQHLAFLTCHPRTVHVKTYS